MARKAIYAAIMLYHKFLNSPKRAELQMKLDGQKKEIHNKVIKDYNG